MQPAHRRARVRWHPAAPRTYSGTGRVDMHQRAALGEQGSSEADAKFDRDDRGTRFNHLNISVPS